MKKHGVIIGVFLASLAVILVSAKLLRTEAEVAASSTKTGISASESLLGPSSSAAPEISGDLRPKHDIDPDYSSVSEEQEEALPERLSVESHAVKHNALNADFLIGADDIEGHFSGLAEEFRTAANIKGSEKREQFQQFFYAQNQILNGEVSLDVLECGGQLCVAELRGIDAPTLRAFLDGQVEWEGFDATAIIEVPTQQAEVTRLIFSHDPEINGVTIPSFEG